MLLLLACALPLTIADTIHWNANFNNGDFSEITADGGGEVQSDNGATSTIVSANTFEGAYSVKSTVTTAPTSGIIHSKVIRWLEPQSISEYYFGAALYLPTDFEVPLNANWVNIMQTHAKNDSAYGIVALIMGQYAGELKMQLCQQDKDGVWHVRHVEDAILGQWFRVVLYCKFTETGHLGMYLSTSTTGGIEQVYFGDHDMRTSDNYYNGAFVDTGIYQSYQAPEQYVLSDSMIVANSLSSATPQGTQPTATTTPQNWTPVPITVPVIHTDYSFVAILVTLAAFAGLAIFLYKALFGDR